MSEEPNSGSEASHENMHSLIEICYSESDLYLDEVVNGNAPPPASPPPLAHPSMWNPKTHTVQEQLALPANTAAPMHVAEPALGAEATGQDEVATEAGAEEVKKAKRIYHRWGDNVVDFFFDFEGLHALPRNTCVKLVKDNYPAIFPPHFNESVVRKWENNCKQNKKSNGPGKDWRKGHTILPMELLVFLGTLVTRQYLAGVPMTARLLVPLTCRSSGCKRLRRVHHVGFEATCARICERQEAAHQRAMGAQLLPGVPQHELQAPYPVAKPCAHRRQT